MPIYEYECDDCKHRTELLQKLSDPPLEKCPECGSTVRKVVSAAGLQFKGSGFYITDYAKNNGQGTTTPKEEKNAEKSTSASESTPKKESPAKKESPSKSSEKSKD